ncbi:hypothetical protein [Kitasatospora sp. NPDC048407]|uniref:hypothetical protein n=1 Tax=Kitasatospora sp. NPDC048407 TaxID=3364051 RepID=UPI00371D6011
MPAGAQVLAGIELGGIPLVVALSAATGLPAGFVRRLPKPYGSHRQIEGIAITVPRTALIGDVVRSGSQLLTVGRTLRMAGSPVTDAVCGPERPLGGRTVPAEPRVSAPPPRPTAVDRVMSRPDPLPPIVSADGWRGGITISYVRPLGEGRRGIAEAGVFVWRGSRQRPDAAGQVRAWRNRYALKYGLGMRGRSGRSSRTTPARCTGTPFG